MFLPKVEVLENRMLKSSIGRYIVQRTQAYFQSSGDKKMKASNWIINSNEILPDELKEDIELATDISRDPNSMAYFSDESAIANLLKRQTIQIALWKNVLCLRQGKFFSKDDAFTADDGITELVNILSSYDWTYFDSPELYQVQDEGTMLRKLLSVFSLRPTFTMISSFVAQNPVLGGLSSSIGSVSRATYINTPICNVRLPVKMGSAIMPPTRLTSSLTQSDWFIENKMLVPKAKQVIYSRKVVFFYVNRRYQSINFGNIDSGCNYMAVPTSLSGLTSINTNEIIFDRNITIGSDPFKLRSVLVLNKLADGRLSTGCSSFVIQDADITIGLPNDTFWNYDPVGASHLTIYGGTYIYPNPIELADEFESGIDDTLGFTENVKEYGTIFMYVE